MSTSVVLTMQGIALLVQRFGSKRRLTLKEQ
jgi:hypothetical protein